MLPPHVESGWSWTRGLRPSRAVLLEVVRIAVAAFLVVNMVFAAFFLGLSHATSLSFTPHDPKYAGIAALNRQVYALDQPLATQYVVFLANTFTGNLGTSFYYRTPVASVVWDALPLTFELMIASLLWALLIGGLLGWGASGRRFPRAGAASRSAGSVLYAIPVFAALLLLIDLVGVTFHMMIGPQDFPLPRVTGFFTLDSLLSGDFALFERALGATALLALPAGMAFAMPVLHRVRKAIEARRGAREFAGLPQNRSLPFVPAFRASLPSLVGAVGLLLPFLLGATLFAELLSSRRGVGWDLVQALYNLDAPLYLGMLLLPSLVVLLVSAPFTLLAAAFTRGGRPFAVPPSPSPSGLRLALSGALRRLVGASSLPFWIGIALVAVPVGLSAIAPIVAPLGPLVRVAPIGSCTSGIDCPLSPPSPQHPLGVDYYGLDIFREVLWGGVYLLETLAVALCAAAGLGLVLGLFLPPLGRAAEVPTRAFLGGVAALPILVLLWLLVVALPLSLALGLAFVPVFFRDVRDRAASATWEAGDPPPRFVGLRGWSLRVDRGGRVAIPGFLARLPRRAAEMALLVEAFTFLGVGYLGGIDWGYVILYGSRAGAFVYNPAWVWAPALLLGLLTAGLVLISDGLRRAVGEEERPTAAPPPTVSLLPPPVEAGGNP